MNLNDFNTEIAVPFVKHYVFKKGVVLRLMGEWNVV